MPSFPPGVHLKGGRNAAPVLARLAREFYEPIIPVVAELRNQGLSLRAIARELEKRGIKARFYEDSWSATQVRRVLLRAAEQGITPPIACQAGPASAKLVPTSAPKPAAVPAKPEEPQPQAKPAAPSPPGGEVTTPSGSSPAARQITLWLKHGVDGPHAIEQVERMLADGTATPQTMARANNGPWRPLSIILGEAISN
jgi:hypothetical protein